VGWVLEAEEEVVEADSSMGLKTVSHGREVDGAVVLVDLDRVAAAEGDVRTAFTGQMGEDAFAADFACGVWFGGADLAALVAPEVVAQERAAHEVVLVREELEGLGDLD
jgi:hypothetical protein